MKKNFLSKLFTIIGFLILAFVALNMNACSKDKKDNNVNPNMYGYGFNPGGGSLANAVGFSPDGMVLQLSISGMNGGQAFASGILTVQSPLSMGCALQQGQYMLQTMRPGIYNNGDFYPPMGQGFTLMASNGMQIYVEGFISSRQEPNGARRMFAQVNIPGCPSTFN